MVADLYHNETTGLALCMVCDMNQDALDALDAGTAMATRLRDWHAERVASLMALGLHQRGEGWLDQLAAHMRDAHDLTCVIDALEGKS
jgi:hypothetical protein